MPDRARRISAGILAILFSIGLLVAGTTSPAAAATCRTSYDSDGFPQWSRGCSTKLSPGKFGPLKMGKTTVRQAKAKHYLAYNKFCARWDGLQAYGDWRSKAGKVVAWRAYGPTTKGLYAADSLAKARRLYPSLKRTGYMPNQYIANEGWRIYSVKNKNGWLDIYRYTTASENAAFFAVRAKSVRKPVTSWSQDGC